MVTERAKHGAVARISGVQGAGARAALAGPRLRVLCRFAGAALRAGEPFTVWEAEDINMRATPTLASDVGELIWRMLERERTGIHHCCGGEAVTRAELARATVRAFDLDGELLRFGPPPPPAVRSPTTRASTARAPRPRSASSCRASPSSSRACGSSCRREARGGDLEATFAPEAGMVCHSLRHRGEELLGQRDGLEAYAKTGKTMGIPFLHPWANRLGAWSYEALGTARRPARQAAAARRRHRPADARHDPAPVARAEPERIAELDGASDAFPFPHTVRLQATSATHLRITTTIEAHDGPCR